MRIRVIGAADLVREIAARMEGLGMVGREYPSRHGSEIRWYVDVDDRVVAVALDLADDMATAPTLPAPRRRR